MKQYLIIGVAIVLIVAILYIILKLCSDFRRKAYKLFLLAEKKAKRGQKMDYVVSNIYEYIPNVVKIFISEDTLRKILQKMFDEIKDLLDDGKINKSIKER